MRTILVVALAWVGGCTCGGSKGELVGAAADVGFVTEKGAAVASNEDGIVAISLDGSKRRTLFADALEIEHVSADYQVWVASDSETNMFIGDLATGKWRRVKELDGIFSAAAVSPDGTQVAASRHSDFRVQGAPDEDTLFLVDVKSLAVTTLPKTTDHWPTTLRWSADGSALFLVMAHSKPAQWVDLATKQRTVTPKPLAAMHGNPAYLHGSCKEEIVHDKFATDVKVKTAAGALVTVVSETGRKRGFHDYQSDFGEPKLTPKCGYVLFTWQRKAWLADAKGAGKAGPLFDGDVHFFADPKLLTP